MSDYTTLADYRGWSIFWQSHTGKLYIKQHGSWNTHDFHERPRDRLTAVEIAKGWIDHR